ncbi:MAG: glycosyltransferase family 4 protein [Patescibacteria group bacterium]
MKILVVSQRWYPDTFGGSEHVAAEQSRRLAALGHEVTVLTEYVNEVLPPEEYPSLQPSSTRGEGEKLISSPQGGEGGVRGKGSLRIIRYGRPAQFRKWGSSVVDIRVLPPLARKLHAETPFDRALAHHPFPAYGFFRAGLKIPTLYMFHASTASEAEVEGVRRKFHGIASLARPLISWGFIHAARFVEGRALAQASRIAVLSDFSAKILRETYPKTAAKIVRIPCGIDHESFARAEKPAAKTRLGLPAGKPLLLTVRRLTARMGLHELLYAALRLREQFPEAHLFIIGEGPLRDSLSNEISQLGLKNYVTLVGTVPLADLPLYYQAADLFVLPTAAFEGLGMSTLEALACGTPVVGTPVGATPEILRELDVKLLTKDATAEAIADGIARFFSLPPSEHLELGRRARALVLAKYDWEKAIEKLEEVLVGSNNQAAFHLSPLPKGERVG